MQGFFEQIEPNECGVICIWYLYIFKIVKIGKNEVNGKPSKKQRLVYPRYCEEGSSASQVDEYGKV